MSANYSVLFITFPRIFLCSKNFIYRAILHFISNDLRHLQFYSKINYPFLVVIRKKFLQIFFVTCYLISLHRKIFDFNQYKCWKIFNYKMPTCLKWIYEIREKRILVISVVPGYFFLSIFTNSLVRGLS